MFINIESTHHRVDIHAKRDKVVLEIGPTLEIQMTVAEALTVMRVLAIAIDTANQEALDIVRFGA